MLLGQIAPDVKGKIGPEKSARGEISDGRDRRRPRARSSRDLPAFLAGNFPRRGLKSPAGIQTHA